MRKQKPNQGMIPKLPVRERAGHQLQHLFNVFIEKEFFGLGGGFCPATEQELGYCTIRIHYEQSIHTGICSGKRYAPARSARSGTPIRNRVAM
jgi:hypothetical protein